MSIFGRKAQKVLLVLFSVTANEVVKAVLQSLVLDVTLSDASESSKHVTMLASQAFFGPLPDMDLNKNPTLLLSTSPEDNHFLCDDQSTMHFDKNVIVMVPRGNCTFESKVLNAQRMGAQAVLVYGALEGRYVINQTNETDHTYTVDDILYPLDKFDYDCSKGQAFIPNDQLSFDPLPYNDAQNNPLLMGENSLCMRLSSDNLQNCESKACLLTGNKNGETMEACCAWDLPIWLYMDAAFAADAVNIPSAYITMEQAQELFTYLHQNSAVSIVLYSRWRPSVNASSMLIWALGVFVAAVAAYLTADDYHKHIRKTLKAQERRAQSNQPQARTPQRQAVRNQVPEETLELTAAHALVFIVMASSSLLILFYFKIYGVVKVMYALGCSNAVAQIIILPFFRKIMKTFEVRDHVVWRTGTEEFGDLTVCDFAAFVVAYAIGIVWLFLAFTARNADEIPFFWIMQNIYGASMCIMFLKVIRLNSIYVASVLLIVAFFYDIFFVFITPLIFQKSVMITVATSGGPPKADALWCEKYPDDPDCQGGDPLPMLLTVPRLLDYQGGSSLLGLGDIVLPGLLISFAARFDAAKSLLGVMGGGSGSLAMHCPEQNYFFGCRFCSGGYYGPLVVAYAIGLLMANAAVYLMQMGQPALLYLVPCCLGTMAYIGWRRHELHELWSGPRALRAADAIVYGEEYVEQERQLHNVHTPLPSDENGENVLGSPPSAVDDDDGVALVEDSHGSA